jgi:hypothetical protein
MHWPYHHSGAWDEKSIGEKQCQHCRKKLHSRPLPAGVGLNRVRVWVDPTPVGALRRLCGGDGWISTSWWYILSTLSVVSRGEALRGLAAMAPICTPHGSYDSHFLGPRLSGGEVHHQNPLRLECGLMSWQHVRLDRGGSLLHRGTIFGSVVGCRAWACSCCLP